MFVVHCRIKPGGALNVLEALIAKKIRSGQSVDAIFTLYSDRNQLKVKSGKLKVEIPIITTLPRRLNTVFRRADDTKPRFISSIIDYRNLMPFFPELMKILSWKLKVKNRKLAKKTVTLRNEGSSKKKNNGVVNKKSLTGSMRSLPCYSGSLHFADASVEMTHTILISSYAVAKNIDIPAGYTTELYMHQPMQYIWTLYDDYLASFSGWKKRLFERVTPRLRRRDQQERNFDYIMTNSYATQELCHTIYRRKKKDMKVVYPPLASIFFNETVTLYPDKYFLYIGRLSIFAKHLDTIIQLCNRHKVQLLIAGDGPDKEYLMSIAGPTIIFLGRIHSIDDKIKLLKRAQGMINISHESFGITTAEALLLGVPVFGYQGGATPELVNAKSGILTPSMSDKKVLDEYFSKYLTADFDRQEMQDRAKKILSEGQKFWDS